ncbi:MAG: ABC transporter permease subunit [Thermoplasmatales archaeon]
MRLTTWFVVIFTLGLPLLFFAVRFASSFNFELAFAVFWDPYFLDGIYFTATTVSLTTILSLLFGISASLVLLTLPVEKSRALAVILVLSVLNPPFVGAIGYKQLIFNLGLGEFKMVGIALSQSITLFPIVANLIDTAFRNIDRSLIESAILFKTSNSAILRKILLPLILPALGSVVIFCIVGSLADLGSPLIFEERRFLSIIIFNLITDKDPFGIGLYLVFYYVVLFGLLFSLVRAFTFDIPVETVSGGHTQPKVVIPRPLKGFCTIFLAILIILAYLPQLYVLWLSILDYSGNLTLNNYLEAIKSADFYRALSISFFLALASTALGIIVVFFVSWLGKRKPFSIEAKALDYLSLIPLVFPTLLISFLLVVAYKNTPLDNTKAPLLLLLLVYIVKKIPQGVRVLSGLLKQIGMELEDCAKVFGIKFSSILLRIYAPILSQTFLRLGVNFFVLSLFETSASLVIPVEEKWFPLSKLVYQYYSEPENFHPACAMLSIVLVISYICAALVYKTINR